MKHATLSSFEFPCDRCYRVRFLDVETNLCAAGKFDADGKPLYKATCHEASVWFLECDEAWWRDFFSLGIQDDYDDEAA